MEQNYMETIKKEARVNLTTFNQATIKMAAKVNVV